MLHDFAVFVYRDNSTSLERLRLECLDIRTQVDQSTADVHGSPVDVHGSPSEVGSACDEEDATAVSADNSSQCLVDVSQITADVDRIQQGWQPFWLLSSVYM